MKFEERIPTVIDFAYEIVDLHRENRMLRSENKRLKKKEEKYNKFVDDAIKHDQEMMTTIFNSALQVAQEKES